MTTYKEIFGKQIKQLSTDPTDAGAEGQVWYNSTSGTFKTVVAVGAWASGASMNTAAYGRGGCGTTTAGLVFGGNPGPTVNTETYDGASYAEVNNLATARRYVAGFGTQTAAVCAGGNTPPGRSTAVEEWNGSSWTANPNSLPTAVQTLRGTGTATAGLVFGGNTGAGGATTANTQTFDGTSWSEVNNLNTSRSGLGGAGTQTATLAYGGTTGVPASIKTETESWDGSSWTTSPSPLIAARNNMGAAGTNTAAMSFGGNSGTTSTQNNDYYLYNDTTWITQPSMAVARSYIAGFGTSTSAIGAGGYGPAFNPNQARTEEFTTTIYSPIAATWASTTSTPTPSGYNAGASGGTSTAGFMAGGQTAPNALTNLTFNFDGTSWTGSGNMGDARMRMNLGVGGTQTAGLGVGGYSPGVVTSVEEYDGSSWSGGGALPTATQQSGGAGPQTSYMMLGTDSDRSEGLSYNGSAWGAEGSSSQGFAYGALAGQETAALAFYGATSPAGTSRSTGEEYNGTAWTTVVPSLPNQGSSGGAGGTSTASVFAGNSTTARYWDGTTVAATASMATARGNYYSIGSSADGFIAASGSSPGVTRNTEQYNAEQQVLGYKTLTSS